MNRNLTWNPLRQSVVDSVRDSVRWSVREVTQAPWNSDVFLGTKSAWYSICYSVELPVCRPVEESIRDSVWDTVRVAANE